MDTSGVASLSQDVLEVIGSYLETRDLVSSFALASRTLNDAADQCAAMRCRALFSSSAEIERRGVRLGATFLARRSRPLQMTQTPCSAREPHLIPARIPLASRPLQNMPEEEAVMSQDWPSDVSEDRDFDPYHENPTLEEALKKVQLASTTQTLPGLYFLIDVTVKTRDGIIVGRRSVMVDGAVPLSMDVVRFDEPLTIAEDLEPDFFYSEHFNSVEEDFACGWYMEFGNIVGCRNVVHVGETTMIIGSEPLNPNFPEQLILGGYIDRFRPSQLSSRRREVSVRVDLFRSTDGKSMCLLDSPVGVPNHNEWPGQSNNPYDADFDEEEDDLGVKLVIDEASHPGETLFPLGGVTGQDEFDTFHCAPTVFAEYPEVLDGEDDVGPLTLTGVRLGFVTSTSDPTSEGWLNFNDKPHVGAKAIHGLRALDAWT